MASPNPEDAKSNENAAIEENERNQDQRQRARKTQPLSVERAPANTRNPDDQQCYSREQFPVWKLVLQVVMTIATAGAFIAATVYAHYARQQRDKMTESIGVTRDLVGTADKQLTYSERPWLGLAIPNVTQNLAHDQPMKISVPFENSGKSPALHVSVHEVFKSYRTFIEDAPLEIPFRGEPSECYRPKPDWSDDLGGEIVLPGSLGMEVHLVSPIINDDDLPQFAPATPTPSPTPTPSAITATPVASPTPLLPPMPQLGHIRLYLVGCADYFDEFHIAHRTSFCQFYVPGPPSLFAFCMQGNSAD